MDSEKKPLTLPDAQARALAEFADIEHGSDKGESMVFIQRETGEWVGVPLDLHILSAEGMLKLLAAMGKHAGKNWFALIPEIGDKFCVVEYSYLESEITGISQFDASTAPEAVATAALTLPVVAGRFKDVVVTFYGEALAIDFGVELEIPGKSLGEQLFRAVVAMEKAKEQKP